MKNLCITLISVLALSACSRDTSSVTYAYELPSELKDCKVFRMKTETIHANLYVVRCPNSQTTTQHTISNGKHSSTYHAVVIDGE